MENKKTMTKTGSIMSIVAYSINIALLLYSSIILCLFITAIAGTNPDAETQVAIQSALLAFLPATLGAVAISIVMIVLCSKILKYSKLSAVEFDRKKGTIIFVICILFLHGVVGLYQSFDGIGEWTSYINIIISLMLIASGILLTIDFANNSKVANAQIAAEQQAKAAEVEKANAEAKVVESETLEDKLEKLNKLKTDGLITEEEYSKMKSDLLNK